MARRKQLESKSSSAASSSGTITSSWQNLRMSQVARQQQKQKQEGEQLDQQEQQQYGSTHDYYQSNFASTSSSSQQQSSFPTESSSSSSIASSTGGGESRIRHDISASSSSGSSASIAKSSRARVSMACIHCRQRKIRCDGSQPTCSTCFRLGRECSYESITEMENILAREKKKRSKEAKQARLTSLAGLGIPIPSRSASIPTTFHQYPHQQSPSYVRSLSGSSTTSQQRAQGSHTVGVIRDSRLAKQGRTRPYAVQPSQHSQQQQYARRGTQEEQFTSQYYLAPPQRPEEQISSQHNRRRGITLDSYPASSPQIYQEQSADSERNIGGTSINVTSLSQPTTPEAAYSLHVSMLSRELSPQHSHSPAEIARERTASGIGAIGKADTQDYPITINAPTTTITPDENNSYRPEPFLSEVDYTLPSTAFSSAVPSATSRSSAADSTLATSFQSNIVPVGASPSMVHRFVASNPDIDQQLAMRRRSSFDVGDFWRRTSVADAAVVSFFDRVVQAKGSRRSEDEVGYGSTVTSVPTRITAHGTIGSEQQQQSPPAPQDDRFRPMPSFVETSMAAQSSTATMRGNAPPQGIESTEYYPMYSNLQEVMLNTAPLDTPYTALTSNPTPLTFQHPFALATSGGQQPEIQAPKRMQSRAESSLDPSLQVSATHHQLPPSEIEYHQQAPTSQISSSQTYGSIMYPPGATSIPPLPSPSSPSSSSLARGTRLYPQQASPTSTSSMNASSFSGTYRAYQRAPPPMQLDLANLSDFEAHRQSLPMPTDGSSSSYATAESLISSAHQQQQHQRMTSTGTPGSATSFPSSNVSMNNPGAYFNTQQTSNFGGSGSGLGIGAAPPLPTPMTELSTNLMAMAPPSNPSGYMTSPTRLVSRMDNTGTDQGSNEQQQYYPHQQDDPYHRNQQRWQ